MPCKLDQDARPDEKLLKLYMLLLFNDREYSLTSLADKINCSKQTVARLLKRIDENYPAHLVERRESRQKYYRFKRPSISVRTAIDSSGLRQLALCRDLVKGLLPEEDWELVNLSVQQAKTNLSRVDYGSYEDAVIGQSISRGYIDYESKREQLAAIEKCILNKKCCTVDYEKEIGDKVRTYNFAPQRLLTFHNGLYAWGWLINEEGPVKTDKKSPIKLALHRMLKVQQDSRSSVSLTDMDPDDEKIFGFMQDHPFKVRIYFDRSVVTYISDRVWSRDQKIIPQEDGGVILDFSASNKQELMSFVLSLGSKAKIIEPEDLKNMVNEELQLALRNYG